MNAMKMLQQAINIQNLTKKEATLNYLKSVKEIVRSATAKLNLIEIHVKLNMQMFKH